jgi:hypothetical protein
VMKLHRLGVNIGLQCVVRVGQCWQYVSHLQPPTAKLRNYEATFLSFPSPRMR